MTRRAATPLAALAFALLFALAPLTAGAHPLGQRPVLAVAPAGQGFDVAWIVAADDMAALGASLGFGPVQPVAYAEYDDYEAYLRERLLLEADGEACILEVVAVEEVPTGYATTLDARCASQTEELTLTSRLLLDLSRRYVHLTQIETPSGTRRGSLTVAAPTLELDLRSPASPEDDEDALGPRSDLESFVRGDGSLPLIVALGIAVALGAVHGLSPGHGKTLTAAYVAGSRGTLRQAALLAVVVALAHGVSTLALAAIASGIDLLAPGKIVPWLEGASAVLAAVVGIALLRGVRAHTHEHAPPSEARSGTMWRLVAIGLVGGIVPGPEAFAVSFLAVALDRIALGLVLVAAFSVGLALVVFAVAALAVLAGSRLPSGHRVDAVARVAGAVVFFAVAILLGIRAVGGG